MTLGIPKEIHKTMNSLTENSTETFCLTNSEHQMILDQMADEVSLPFPHRNQYYSDEEEKMITGYISKTRLSGLPIKLKEDLTFEKLIRGVGRLKSLRIILETVIKDLKSKKKPERQPDHKVIQL